MKKNRLLTKFFVICLPAIALAAASYLLFAPKAFGAFFYPIEELGSCRDARECRLFCDIPKNSPACWSYNKYSQENQILGITTITDELSARKNGITFPIAELGNCLSPAECKEFCRLEANRSACTDFAVKKNLQKSRLREIANNVLLKAKTELGCDSKTSCHNLCRKPENQEICRTFGEKYDLIKKTATGSASFHPEIWAKVKQDLGCSDQLSCKNLCEHPDNKRRCGAFAAKYLQTKASQESTKSGKPPQVFLGPGGCKTEKECFEYCSTHQGECPNFPKKTPQIKTSPTPDISGNEEFPQEQEKTEDNSQ